MCKLSPVGSVPQYKAILSFSVNSFNASKSVVWLIAPRHCRSSIIFMDIPPKLNPRILKNPRLQKLKSGTISPRYHLELRATKLVTHRSSSVTGRSVHLDGLRGCNSSSVLGQAHNYRRLSECPADNYCCPLHCPFVAVIVPVHAGPCQAFTKKRRPGINSASFAILKIKMQLRVDGGGATN